MMRRKSNSKLAVGVTLALATGGLALFHATDTFTGAGDAVGTDAIDTRTAGYMWDNDESVDPPTQISDEQRSRERLTSHRTLSGLRDTLLLRSA